MELELRVTSTTQAVLIYPRGEQQGAPDLGPETQAQLLALSADPKAYGTLLFEKTFRGALLKAYNERIAVARNASERVRLRVNAAEPSLRGLWWETLFDRDNRLALGRSREFLLSRYLPTAIPTAMPTLGRPKGY